MSNRNIERILAPGPAHMVGDGFRVHNFIPSVAFLSMQRMSPFLMLDYGAKFYFPSSERPKGVGVHPHRGFETVTIAYKGKVAHHDSAGNSGIIGEGDVQWMTAASGVLHKEYHEEQFSREGGWFQMVQLWVNLPAKYKMSAPKYQEIVNAAMGKHAIGEKGSFVEVIAGNYGETKGPASTFTPVHLMNAKLLAGDKADFSFPENFNTAMLVIEGKMAIQEKEVPVNHFVLMENKGTDFNITALEDSIVLVLSGAPIHEPIVAHGPFVMNTREEIYQAFQDAQTGKFGILQD